MLEIDLSKNPKVKLKVPGKDIEFDSKVVKYEKDRVFLEILTNKKPDNSILFREGTELEMTICSTNRIVTLNSLVIETFGAWEVCMELHDEYDVIQRRRYVRTNISCWLELKSPDLMFKAQTVNIGGGGVCFVGNNCFEIGQNFQFKLLLPGHDDISGEGVIINKIEVDGEILVMFNFAEMDKDIRNKVIRFCFEKEFNS
jgi:c-di-GMP-binding flagellar brake protein YcgR